MHKEKQNCQRNKCGKENAWHIKKKRLESWQIKTRQSTQQFFLFCKYLMVGKFELADDQR